MASRIAPPSPPGSLFKVPRKKRPRAAAVATGQRRPRETNNSHLAFLRTLPCCCCPADPCKEAAHIRFASFIHDKPETGIGRKPDDRDAVPLCRTCHQDGPQAQHKVGERVFWDRHHIDPVKLARALYALTGQDQAARKLVALARSGLFK